MAHSSGRSAAAGAGGRPAGRPRVPGRGRLFGAVAMITIGSFLPWVDTAFGNVSGAQGAGLWTFYAAMLGLAGALAPKWILMVVQGAIMSAAAVALPVWQVIHLLTLVELDGWRPGPGLVLVFGGGVLAGVGAYEVWRAGRPTASA